MAGCRGTGWGGGGGWWRGVGVRGGGGGGGLWRGVGVRGGWGWGRGVVAGCRGTGCVRGWWGEAMYKNIATTTATTTPFSSTPFSTGRPQS